MKTFFFILALACPCQAFMTIQLSSGAPESVEQSLLASTTAQYNVFVQTNPFFPNTYQLYLYGYNPNYNPTPTNLQLLNDLVTVDSYTYVSGFADGQSYNQYTIYDAALNFDVECSTPTVFAVYGSTATWDYHTCQTALNTIANWIYQLHLSTPTVVPGAWQ
jgi:hypothetical protein